MVSYRQKMWTDRWTDERMDGRSQNYIPPTLSGDNKTFYLLKYVQNINKSSLNEIILYHFVDHNLVQLLYD